MASFSESEIFHLNGKDKEGSRLGLLSDQQQSEQQTGVQPFEVDASGLTTEASFIDSDKESELNPKGNSSDDSFQIPGDIEYSLDGSYVSKKSAFRRFWNSLYLYQIKALLFKNMIFQSRQMGTNLCHLVMPVVMLTIMSILMNNMQRLSEMNQTKTSTSLLPLIHNMPLKLVQNSTAFPLGIFSCDKRIGFSRECVKNRKCQESFLDAIQRDPLRESCKGQMMPLYQQFGERGTEDSFNSYLKDLIVDINQAQLRPGVEIENINTIPDGNIELKSASRKGIKYKLQVNDFLIAEYHKTNGLTKFALKFSQKEAEYNSKNNQLRKELKNKDSSWPMVDITGGLLNFMDIVTRNSMRVLNNKIQLVASQTFMEFFDSNNIFMKSATYLIGSTTFPFALGFVLPLFLYLFVLEKSSGVKKVMMMHGLKEVHYWMVNIFTSFLLYCLIYGGFFLTGKYLLELRIFYETGPSLFHSVNLLWGINQVGLGLFFQLFFDSPRIASILGYIISMVVLFASIDASMRFFPEPIVIPWNYLMMPQMSFTRMYHSIGKKCIESRCFRGVNELDPENYRVFSYLVFTAFFYPITGILLNYAVFRGWLSPKGLSALLKPARRNHQAYPQLEDLKGGLYSPGTGNYPGKFIYENALTDIQKEKNSVDRIADSGKFAQYPVIVKGASKVYSKKGKKFEALKPTYFTIARGEVFGLLGPNGAGKTTLISILTGGIKATTGFAYIGGAHIQYDLPSVYKQIGVCPQFDVFWEDLTIEEHLLFYLRLKGAHVENERKNVEEILKEVELYVHRKKLAKYLSGGMRRRMSLAIALIGNPKAVFLDEPTTGLDPLNREIFWGILEKIKPNKSIILTTHLMQEADILSDKIGRLISSSHHQ